MAHESCGCCGSGVRRRSVTEYFDLGRQRMTLDPLPLVGDERRSANGLTVRFSVRLEDGRVREVRYRASLCMALVAYCELVAELVTDRPLPAAARLTRADLVAGMPGIPVVRHDRATLAWTAFVTTLGKALA